MAVSHIKGFSPKASMTAPLQIRRSVSSRELDSFSFTATAPDFLCEWLVTWLEGYINGGAVIRDDQTLAYGYVILKCRVKNRHLTLLSPHFGEMPIQWVEDLGRALGIISAHKYTPESLGLEPDIVTLQQTAIVGERFNERPFFMNHCEPCDNNPNDSGWFVGRHAEDVDNNDPSSLNLMSLYEVAFHAPDVVQFLSLPIGCMVLFSEGHPVIGKDDEELDVPPDSYLGQVLAKRFGRSTKGEE